MRHVSRHHFSGGAVTAMRSWDRAVRRLRMEFGPGGGDFIDAEPGDFLYVATHAVHREANPTEETATLVVVRTGSGDPVTNVDGPARA